MAKSPDGTVWVSVGSSGTAIRRHNGSTGAYMAPITVGGWVGVIQVGSDGAIWLPTFSGDLGLRVLRPSSNPKAPRAEIRGLDFTIRLATDMAMSVWKNCGFWVPPDLGIEPAGIAFFDGGERRWHAFRFVILTSQPLRHVSLCL